MLVLSRKVGQTIEIPSHGISIRVSAIKKSRAVIGIEAPEEVKVVRGEKENASSSPSWLGETPSANQLLFALETEIASLVDLAADERQATADQVGHEVLQTLRKLRRQLAEPSLAVDGPLPLSEYLTVRSESAGYQVGQPASKHIQVA